MARVSAVVDDDLLRRLRHVLLDEQITFSRWLREQVLAAVERQPRPPARDGRRKKPVKSRETT